MYAEQGATHNGLAQRATRTGAARGFLREEAPQELLHLLRGLGL